MIFHCLKCISYLKLSLLLLAGQKVLRLGVSGSVKLEMLHE